MTSTQCVAGQSHAALQQVLEAGHDILHCVDMRLIVSHICTMQGARPLQVATQKGYASTTSVLLSHGAVAQ